MDTAKTLFYYAVTLYFSSLSEYHVTCANCKKALILQCGLIEHQFYSVLKKLKHLYVFTFKKSQCV